MAVSNQRVNLTGKSLAPIVVGGAVAWVLIAGLALVQLWPIVPASSAQWLLFIVLAPPIYVVTEASWGWIFSEKHGNSISRQKFSLLRVLMAFPFILGVFLLGWWVAVLFK